MNKTFGFLTYVSVSVLIAGLCALPAPVTAGVYDDCKAW